MVDSSRRRGRRDVMSSHNRSWIWGRNVVLETIRAERWPIIEVTLGERVEPQVCDEVLRIGQRREFAVSQCSDVALTKACRTSEHQGFAARMRPYPYLGLADLFQSLSNNAVLVLLDRLQDPFNFGAIIRSASVLGIQGIIVGTREQVEVNSQVARSSVGAVNHLPIVQEGNLTQVVDDLRQRGFQVVAASEAASVPLYEAQFQKPTLIVIGNEGRGVHADLLSRCDQSVSIPMTGQVGSLNAAVAAGILFYEVQRQRQRSNLPR